MAKVRQRKSGLFEARVQRDGRRYSVYGRTEAEALQRLAELERRLAIDQPPAPGRLTVGELYQRWLATEAKRWKPRTAWNYQRLYDRSIGPALGNVRLARLTPDRLQRFFAGLPGNRVPHEAYRALHRCFTLAVRWGWLPANPCHRVIPPAYRPARPELPDAEALARLFQRCLESDDDYAPLVGLALLTGLRLGEITALRWGDVDLEAGRVHVQRSGQWIGGKWTETEPKTAAGRRTVPIGELGVRLLKRQKAVAARRKLQAGPAWQENGLVFPARDGRPLRGSVAERAVERLCRQAGVPRLTPHQLRHASASLALAAGTPLPDVSRRLGHSTPAITTRLYIHSLSDGRHVAEAIERALGG